LKNLTNLEIYKIAVEIAEEIWDIVDKWESFAKWTMGKQIVEAADGIAATMKEGYYRYDRRDKRRFFQFALASAQETKLWWWRSHRRKLITSEQYDPIKTKLEELIPKTINYIHYLKKEPATKISSN
jgi:four helix bundle protein